MTEMLFSLGLWASRKTGTATEPELVTSSMTSFVSN